MRMHYYMILLISDIARYGDLNFKHVYPSLRPPGIGMQGFFIPYMEPFLCNLESLEMSTQLLFYYYWTIP